MANLTEIIKPSVGPWYNHAGRNHFARMFDMSKNGLNSIGIHELITIPKGNVFVGAYGVITETFIGGSSIQFEMVDPADLLSPNYALVGLLEGQVFGLGFQQLSGFSNQNTYIGYAKDNDLTINLDTPTAFTSGKFILFADFIEIQALLDQPQ